MASEEAELYPQPGEILEDKYEIQTVLGKGAMGAVIRATHLLRKAPVALKFMSPKIMGRKGVVERFLNEGIAASQIDSEYVVKVLDVSKLPTGVPYLVMEYLEGEDLRELLARDGTPGLDDIPRSVHFALQILRGLQVAHRVGIVHRDMKPANCFVVRKDGEPDHVKIVDFGISKVQQSDSVDLTHAGSALGTPLYMSPEQARSPKDVDARSDLYGVATMLYELVSGGPPFVPESGTLSELFMMLGTEEPVSLEETRGDLPHGLWAVIQRGLCKDPKDRFQDAAEMAEALAPYADERSDHVLRQLLKKTARGFSRFPLAPGPPTHVDEHDAHPPSTSTIVIGEQSEGAMAVSGIDSALAHAGTLDASRVPSPAAASVVPFSPAVPVAADTAQGTVHTVDGEGTRRTSPLLWVGVALAASLVVGVGGWALSTRGPAATEPDALDTATSATPPPPEATEIAPPPPVPAPSATLSASASAQVRTPPAPPSVAPPVPPPSAVAPPVPHRPPGLPDIDLND